MTAAQLPSGSNLDQQTLAYFQSVGSFEDFANSIGEGDGLQTVDTLAASLSAQKVLSAPPAKAMGEREEGSNASKPSTETRKPGRRIVRPPLESPAEPPADTKVSEIELSTVIMEEGKSGGSHEPEPPARKRLASSSSLSDLREDSVAQEEAGSGALPSLKRSKHSEASVDSADDTVQQLTIQSLICESQPARTESMETGQAQFLSNDEIIDEERAEEDVIDDREETEEQQKDANLEEEVPPYEGDAIMEEEPAEKPSTSIEVVDDPPRSGDAKEMASEVESEDEREEGELMPDDPEQDDGDSLNELITEEVASPETEAEMTEEVDTGFEEAAEASSQNSPQRSMADQGTTTDLDQSPTKSAAALPQTSVSERRSPSPGPSTVATETDEPAQTRATGRTISIAERARENARLRQARMTTTTPPPRSSVRGRALGGVRGARVSRGRGGRG